MSQLLTRHCDDQALLEAQAIQSFLGGFLDRIVRIVAKAKITNETTARIALKQLPPIVADMCNNFKLLFKALKGENVKVLQNLEETVAILGTTKKDLTSKTIKMEELKPRLASFRNQLCNCKDELKIGNQSLSKANDDHNIAVRELEKKQRQQKCACVFGGCL